MKSTQTAWRDHLTGVLWFTGGMLITTLVVGAVVIATHADDTPTITAEQPHAVTQVAVVHCPSSGAAETLVAAAACGRTEAVRELLARGADVGETDPRAQFRGRTALHHAVQRGDEPAIQLLLAAGAAPDARDAHGNTALHLLALGSEAAHPLYVARFLIDAGASLDIRNDHELTPLETLEVDHLRMVEHQDLAQMLLRTQRLADGESEPAAPVLKAEVQDTPPTLTAAAPQEAKADETGNALPAAMPADTPVDIEAAIDPAEGPPNAAAPPAEAPAHTEALTADAARDTAPAAATAPETRPADVATMAPSPPPPSQEALIRARLDDWAKAWADKDMAAYFDAYAPAFTPANGLSMFAWRAQREARIAGKRDAIVITLSDIAIEQHGDTAGVDFVQHYRTGAYAEVSQKRIEMKLHKGRWCITAERETG